MAPVILNRKTLIGKCDVHGGELTSLEGLAQRGCAWKPGTFETHETIPVEYVSVSQSRDSLLRTMLGLDADTAFRHQEAMEHVRMKWQQEPNANAAKLKKQRKLKEEQKRQERIEDWERHQQGRGYIGVKSKHRWTVLFEYKCCCLSQLILVTIELVLDTGFVGLNPFLSKAVKFGHLIWMWFTMERREVRERWLSISWRNNIDRRNSELASKAVIHIGDAHRDGHSNMQSNKTYITKWAYVMDSSKDECRQLREKHIGESLNCHMWYRNDPPRMVRASGQYMFDENGTKYLDCINNVSHVGHCHPKVVEAGIKQMQILNTNHRFLYDELPTYAKRLVDTMPEKLSVCFLVNSGSEANDLAIRLARKVTKRFDLAVLDNGYHGQTFVLNELRPKERRDNKDIIPHVHVIPSPDVYRGKFRKDDYSEEELAEKYAYEVEETFRNAHEQGRDIAGFFIESIQCVAGQLVPPKGFLTRAYNITKKYGALFIADEVQSGFGRVGKHWWAFQIDGEGVTPDIVTMGKPMGNGHPVAGLATTNEIGAALSEGKAYFTTYGGNPVSCAIGIALMDVIEEEKLMERATRVGAYFKSKLCELQKKQKIIGDIRGMGLMVGIDLVEDQATKEPATEKAKQIVNRLYEEKIIFSRDGEHENVLKFKPPMCISEKDIDYIVEKFDMIFTEVATTPAISK